MGAKARVCGLEAVGVKGITMNGGEFLTEDDFGGDGFAEFVDFWVVLLQDFLDRFITGSDGEFPI